jgi:putative redox protein
MARAVATTSSITPAYRVDLRAGRHQLTADEPVGRGGGGLGPNPFELLLSGLAACTATTLRMYADRKGWELSAVEVDVRYVEGGAIERTVTVPADISLEQRQRLADIAERTPVTLALGHGLPISTTVESRTPLPA